MRIYKQSTKDQKAYLLCKLVQIYDELEPTGGSLHLILDDQNYDVDCMDFAVKNNDIIGIEIMKLLREFSTEEREMLLQEGSWKVVGNIEFNEPVNWNND